MHVAQTNIERYLSHLGKRELELENKANILTDAARTRGKLGDKLGAKRKLIEKKKINEQLNVVSNTISILNTHLQAIENTTWNKSMIDALKTSTAAMKDLTTNSSAIEGVEDIMMELEAQIDGINEISRTLAQPPQQNAMGGRVDDDELEQELNDLLYGDDTPEVTIKSEHNLEAIESENTRVISKGLESPKRERVLESLEQNRDYLDDVKELIPA